jgi:hypothetical protein
MTMAMSIHQLHTLNISNNNNNNNDDNMNTLQSEIADFTIISIDDDTFDFKDSTTDVDSKDLPLLIYDAEIKLSWVNSADVLAGDQLTITFVWCESDTSCDASSTYKAYSVTLDETAPGATATATFEVPTLSFTKLFSSKVGIEFSYSRDGANVSTYVSKHKYPSDIATKTTKGVVTVVVVFCVVAIVMALAVLGFFIFKKCKKMRRTRHFPAKDHNFFRR